MVPKSLWKFWSTPASVYRLCLRSRPPFTGVLLGPGPESAPRSAFWAILGTCLGVPQRVLFECFLAFFLGLKTPKSTQKALFGALRGRRQVPKIAQKALRGALSGPGPKKHSCKWRPGSQGFTFFFCSFRFLEQRRFWRFRFRVSVRFLGLCSGWHHAPLEGPKTKIIRVTKKVSQKPREARDLIFKIRSCTVRPDLKIKVFSAVFCLFLILRSDLAL